MFGVGASTDTTWESGYYGVSPSSVENGEWYITRFTAVAANVTQPQCFMVTSGSTIGDRSDAIAGGGSAAYWDGRTMYSLVQANNSILRFTLETNQEGYNEASNIHIVKYPGRCAYAGSLDDATRPLWQIRDRNPTHFHVFNGTNFLDTDFSPSGTTITMFAAAQHTAGTADDIVMGVIDGTNNRAYIGNSPSSANIAAGWGDTTYTTFHSGIDAGANNFSVGLVGDDTSIKLYTNGDLANSATVTTGPSFAGGNAVFIGGLNSSGTLSNQWTSGRVFDCFAIDRTLTKTELNQILRYYKNLAEAYPK